MNKDIVLLDLFSGIGGFHAGLTRSGFNITKSYTSEIDKHAIAIYKYHFKNSEYVGDVTALDGRSITRPNIITFGSPCQDFSVAGKRAGLEGQRSSLIGQAIRLITECRPDFFIWENVKGVFSSNNGEDFWAVIQAFADIGGYRLEWQLLNTAWFLPQNRERIYLVGHLAKDGRNWQGIFPIREGNRLYDEIQQDQGGEGGRASCIGTRYGQKWTDETYIKVVGNIHGDDGHNVWNVHSADGLAPTVRQNHGSVSLIEPTHKHGDDRVYEDIAPTIQSRYGTGGDNVPYVINSAQPRCGDPSRGGTGPLESSDYVYTLDSTPHYVNKIRRLTEIECERLQGFKDGWTQYGDYDGEVKKVSRTQRYKCLGNAVTVDVVAEVGRRLLKL